MNEKLIHWEVWETSQRLYRDEKRAEDKKQGDIRFDVLINGLVIKITFFPLKIFPQDVDVIILMYIGWIDTEDEIINP